MFLLPTLQAMKPFVSAAYPLPGEGMQESLMNEKNILVTKRTTW